MRRLIIGVLVLIGAAHLAHAGAPPNGGFVYLNCENFQVGGPGNFLGNATKTTDANGKCVINFAQGANQYATATFYYPNSAIDVAVFQSYPQMQINSTNSGNFVCFSQQIECTDGSNQNFSANNAGDATPSISPLFSVNTVANSRLDPGTGIPSNARDQWNNAVCVGECRNVQCVIRLTRTTCPGNDDPQPVNLYGDAIGFSTP